MARHRWCNSAAAGITLRAIEGATVLQQVMREKVKLEEAMHCAQNDHRPCLVDAAREVGRNTQMTSNSMHRLSCNHLLPRNNGHLQAMDGAGQGWQAPPRFFVVTTSFPETIGIYQQWTVPARVCGLRPDASGSMSVEDASAL